MPWPFVRTFVHRDTVNSTNDEARRLLDNATVELPLLVWSDRQTAGRGRGTNPWWSDEGSLTFTVAIDPVAHSLRLDQEIRVSLAAAVAVIHALDCFLPPGLLGIRWPNDIEAAGRKLGGILPERAEQRAASFLLVGIGLNVNSRLGDAPRDVERMAGTLSGLADRALDRADVLAAILDRLGPILARLAADDRDLVRRWQYLDVLRGRAIQVDVGGEVVSGQAAGIDERGGLRIVQCDSATRPLGSSRVSGVGEALAQGTVTLFGGRVLRAAE
jgi:BirA family biotin operon repressor/biotin-[acetyl-CoA-carboxylase] ligase